MPRLLIPAATLIVAACAGASSTTTPVPTPAPAAPPPAVVAPPPVVQTQPPPPPPTGVFDPTGTYELSLTFGGNPIPATMELWKENGAWRGYVGNPNLGSADLSTLATDGRWFKGTFVVSGGPTLTFEMEVNNDNTLKGSWSGNGDGSNISGKKTK